MNTNNETAKRRFTPKTIGIVLIGLVGLCVVCYGITLLFPSTPKPSTPVAQSSSDQASASPSETPLPSKTPAPTDTPTQTNTPIPTRTPRPTNTPRPSPTPTQPPKPIVLTGKGDQVVDVEKWDGAALARIKNTGGGNFVLWNYDADGNQIDLLVNTIGNYSGTIPIDFLDVEHTARFQVKSNGSWEITLLPLTEMELFLVPGSYDGNGDNVLALFGSTPDLLKADASKADGNFVVWGYSNTKDLVINEIAPYEGTTILDSGTLVLEVKAEGPWHLEITAK